MMPSVLLSCRAATELMEKKHRRKLSISERMQLFLHTAMCDACRQYEKQSAVLERLLRAKKESTIEPEVEVQTVDLQEKILKQLIENGSGPTADK